MHRKHFFVPATGAPAGDYELYLLGLDWLLRRRLSRVPTDGDLVRVERRRRRPRARPLPPEPDALLEAARLQILRGGRGAALAGVWELSR